MKKMSKTKSRSVAELFGIVFVAIFTLGFVVMFSETSESMKGKN